MPDKPDALDEAMGAGGQGDATPAACAPGGHQRPADVPNRQAEKDMRRVPADQEKRVYAALAGMESNPFGGDIRRLDGNLPGWRRRVGEWRIRFTVDTGGRGVARAAARECVQTLAFYRPTNVMARKDEDGRQVVKHGKLSWRLRWDWTDPGTGERKHEYLTFLRNQERGRGQMDRS